MRWTPFVGHFSAFNEIDPEKAEVIREVFKRIANGERATEVADWLDSIKLEKASMQSAWKVSPRSG